MSLPPLLLERLKKRGLVREIDNQGDEGKTRKASKKARKSDETGNNSQEQEEEIIAEDYSEEAEHGDVSETTITQEKINCTNDNQMMDAISSALTTREIDQDLSIEGPVLGCPNKYNIYHRCSKYCMDKFGRPDDLCPSLDQKKYLLVLLRTYPLPAGWKIVYDPGLKTFYFWDTLSNYVSWLPPTSGAQISLPADVLRSSLFDPSGFLS